MKKHPLASLSAIMLILLYLSGHSPAESGHPRSSSAEALQNTNIGSTQTQGQSVIMNAMRSELNRSMAKLSLKDYPLPYFISYLIKEEREISVTAKYGAIFSFNDASSRPSYIEVRVGSHEADNSRGLKRDYDFDRPPSVWLLDHEFPVDNDADVIKNRLWVLTDLLYKRAMADYLKKKGKAAFKAEEKIKLNDFSLEEKHDFVNAGSKLVFEKEHWLGILRRASKIFLDHPELVDSQIEMTATDDTKYLANSEGASVIEGKTYYRIEASARAWSEDGMLLTHSVRYSCRKYNELPSEAGMKKDINKMIAELKQLRQAEEIKPCTVPAIFGPEMSSVLFHEAIGHRLEGDRQREDEEGHTFKGKVGEKVLPEFLTLIDDPTLSEFRNKTLFGHYFYDDEGVPAQKVILVEDGILRNYLMSRRPIENFEKSNGHGRVSIDSHYYSRFFGKNPMARMANLEVRSKIESNREELERKLIEECKKRGLAYGLIFEGTLGGHTSTDTYDYQAFLGKPKLVYKLNVNEGTRKLIRGVNIVGTPLNTLERIVAAGNDYEIFNGYCGAESGGIPVSGIAPSILLSEIEVQRIPEEKERPPILPPPAFDR